MIKKNAIEPFIVKLGGYESKLRKLIEPILDSKEYALVWIKISDRQNNSVVTFFIEKKDFKKNITLSEIQHVSKFLNDICAVSFNEMGFFKQGYTLEVSSPGIDCILSKRSHFENFLGKLILIKTISGHNLSNKFFGILRTITNDGVELENKRNKVNIFIIFKAITFAKSVWQFEKLRNKKKIARESHK